MLETMMKSIYEKMKGLKDLCFRDKEIRKISKPTSYCCEYPLGKFEYVKETHGPILNQLKQLCVEHFRKFLFGIYSASGAGKSHLMDFICNEWLEVTGIEFIPISMRHMKLGQNENAKNSDEKNEENYMQILMKRLLFSYFFGRKQSNSDANLNLNGRHRRASSFLGNYQAFVSEFESVSESYSFNLQTIFGLIKQEINEHERKMVILIDDITDFDRDEQRSFLFDIQLLETLIVFTTTFHGLPEFMQVSNQSGNYGNWYYLKGVDLSKKLVNEINSLNMNVDSGVLGVILNQFGSHPRSYGMFYYALMNDDILMKECVHGRMGSALNYFVDKQWIVGSYGSNGLLVKLMNDWDCVPFLLCVCSYILDISVDWKKIVLPNDLYIEMKRLDTILKLIEAFEASGIISRTDGNPVKIHPIFLKAWAWRHVAEAQRGSNNNINNNNNNNNRKETERRAAIRNFSSILNELFDLCVTTLTSASAERLAEQLLLLRLNCGKFWSLYTTDDDCPLSKLVCIEEEKEESSVEYEALEWKDIGEVKSIGYFGGIKSDAWEKFEASKELKYDRQLLIQQMRTIKYGVCSTISGNISFDSIVALPLKKAKDKFTRRYCIELKSNVGKLTDHAEKLQVTSKKKAHAVLQPSSQFSEASIVKHDKIVGQFEKFGKVKQILGSSNIPKVKEIGDSLCFVGAYYGRYSSKTPYVKISEVLTSLSGFGFSRYIQQIIFKSFGIVPKALSY